jgi:hypothetical protein
MLEMNIPSPKPAMHRPIKSWGKVVAEHAMVHPTENTNAPREMV